ncbi:hypothetical protein [Pseudomonas avellanae]|uniref:Uncharacterized protein n=1 Tax=Pseudomonas avellanae TaxID=46257 RepID=A0A3M5T514_9PSED|nr:hypothetical protein [Pseudomonas avellanae]RMU28606.1 hypothetical protein ALP32_102192 [Pseudomonas avellanae]UQW70909.1 hypothetical protein L2Y00_10985 [Pseudomonas avellanae]UQW76162.1 hypothetical protein L2Y01_10470 [Pseudomonas avellanae]
MTAQINHGAAQAPVEKSFDKAVRTVCQTGAVFFLLEISAIFVNHVYSFRLFQL